MSAASAMETDAPPHLLWTGSSLLAMQAQFEAHNALDQVTVVKRDGDVQMSSLRQQMDSIQAVLHDELQNVRCDTAMYMMQLISCFQRYIRAPDSSSSQVEEQLLFYPFGGIDVVSPVGLAPSMQCIVFAGAEEFGGNAQSISSDFQKLMSVESAYMRKGMGSTLFDSHDDFERLHQELGLRGVGAMALLRLLGPMQHDVQLLSFFDLDQDGNIIIKPAHSLLHQPCHNAVVGVRERASPDGPMKLLFFVHHNTYMESIGVDMFCKRLFPNALLLKAAPDSMWVHPTEGSGMEIVDAYRRCISRSILPAARAECIVVSDSCQADPTVPRPIFKAPPDSVALHDVNPLVHEAPYELFGYGQRVFWSRGDNLICSVADDGNAKNKDESRN